MKKILCVFVALMACVAMSYAGTTNLTVGSTALSAYDLNKAFVIENTITFSAAVSPSGGVVQVLNVPADSVVMFVEYDVETASTETVSFDIGDDGSATRWKSNAAAGTGGAVLGTATPYLYTAANTIDITCDGDITNGAVRVRALVIDCSK